MPYTYNYSQPDDYHFSLDSIELPRRVAEKLQSINEIKALDLCAGCGVIGFEFQFYRPQISQLDFVEVQQVYQIHFEKNIQLVGPQKTEFKWFNLNYKEMLSDPWKNQYDLILCNPPYFELGQGKLSPSDFKNRCRFYIDSDFATLIEVMLWVLKPNADCFFLMRPLSDHKKDMLNTLQSLINRRATAQVMDDIRGTYLIHLEKRVY